MHTESGYDSEVDLIVQLIWSKVCITISITISIANFTTIMAQVYSGSYRGVGVHYPEIYIHMEFFPGRYCETRKDTVPYFSCLEAQFL